MFFFFSSRRRHTRWPRDWSSDVCSSDLVEAGKITGIIAWHTDRLHRRTVELEEFVGVAEEHGTKVQTVTSGTVDLSTASGRKIGRASCRERAEISGVGGRVDRKRARCDE